MIQLVVCRSSSRPVRPIALTSDYKETQAGWALVALLIFAIVFRGWMDEML